MSRQQVKARRREVETRLRQAQEEGYAKLRRRAEKEKAAYREDLYVQTASMRSEHSLTWAWSRSLAQRPHLEDLAELLAEKEQLQHKIEKTNDKLERAQLAVSQQLGACIKSRVDALRK